MFRRKEDGSDEIQEDTAAGTESVKPVSPAPAAPAATPAASAPTFRPLPPQAAMAQSRPAPTPVASAAASHDAPRAAVSSAARNSSSMPSAKRVLTVGPDIQMKGEITTCDRVVIEGVVDAAMRDVHTVELTESGSLKGTAEVEDAEISGSFEGDITVRGKLTVYSTGKVRGNITFGEIEIQRGGQISGNVRNVSDTKSGGTPPNLFSNKNKAA